MIILIDDLRNFKPAWDSPDVVVCRDSVSGIEALKDTFMRMQFVDEIWLDHDLGGNDTTRPVVRWLEEFRIPVKKIYVHTSNPVGRNYIMSALQGKYNCVVVDANVVFTA